MAGAVLDSQLNTACSSQARFDLAGRQDDANIRRLLRENSMPGAIALSLEREPDYFADASMPGTEKQTIVAREAGRVVCVGNCTVRSRFVNGKKCRVGYLAGLRLDADAAGRFDILRRGYQFFRELQAAAPADYYFTSIAADNLRAREFLERGLPGMPVYEFAGKFVTVLLPVVRGKGEVDGFSRAKSDGISAVEICSFLNRSRSDDQLAPCWSAEELEALESMGLKMNDFRILREKGNIAACAALWDQRSFKQTVIRGYAPWLAWARPAINLAAHIARRPHLPKVGSVLAHAFVSHLALAESRPENLRKCIDSMLQVARGANIQFITMGFDAKDPRLAAVEANFRIRKYHSRIYIVHWPGIGGSVRDLDGRFLCPEVALL